MIKSNNHETHRAAASALILGILAIAMASTAVHAAPAYNTPFYNPETKSYFELYSPDANDPKNTEVKTFGKIQQKHAIKMAAKRFYKGARGRLAVVKSQETHEFLAKHLRPEGAAWIGLRYFCTFKKLMWVTGEIFTVGKDFAKWGPRTWSVQGGSPASGKPGQCLYHEKGVALPVHYWGMEHGFFWNANGMSKEFNAMIIEYPTGKP
mgnify:CR=1 FL=1